MVELVDTTDLKSVAHYGRAGSSPAPGTKREIAAMRSPVFGFGLRDLRIDTAKNVVVVGCFEIPENHIFDNQKVTMIPIPPVQKVSTVKGLASASGFLPDIIADLQLEIEPLLERGSLLLLAAGFAGKPLLLTAKKQGAVALDFGSGLDHVLGYKTRSPELTHLFS